MWHDVQTIGFWWGLWKAFDFLWEWSLGATVLTTLAWAVAWYRSSPLQREMRGAAIALGVVTMASMAFVLWNGNNTPATSVPVKLPVVASSVSTAVPTSTPVSQSTHRHHDVVPSPSWVAETAEMKSHISFDGLLDVQGAFLTLPRPCFLTIAGPQKHSRLRALLVEMASKQMQTIEPCTVNGQTVNPGSLRYGVDVFTRPSNWSGRQIAMALTKIGLDARWTPGVITTPEAEHQMMIIIGDDSWSGPPSPWS